MTSTATHPGRAAWDVVGQGANSVDYVNLLPAYPQPQGEFAKMRIREQTITCGGQMATALATCTQLGLSAKYLGATGTDDNGRRIRLEMERRGIDLGDAVIHDGRTQFAIILVDEGTGERIVLWDRDERLALRDREVPPNDNTAPSPPPSPAPEPALSLANTESCRAMFILTLARNGTPDGEKKWIVSW